MRLKPMHKKLQFVIHEFKKALPPTLFFLVVFHVAALIRGLSEKSLGITPTSSMIATISALVMGKVILLLGDRGFTRRYDDKPLMYPALWKTLIFTLAGSLVMFGEEFLPHVYHEHSLSLAWENLLANTSWDRFWANRSLLVVWLFIYAIVAEFVRVLGRETVRKLFFTQGSKGFNLK